MVPGSMRVVVVFYLSGPSSALPDLKNVSEIPDVMQAHALEALQREAEGFKGSCTSVWQVAVRAVCQRGLGLADRGVCGRGVTDDDGVYEAAGRRDVCRKTRGCLGDWEGAGKTERTVSR